MMEQLSFDFFKPVTPAFDAVEEYAKEGRGVARGKERIKNFFSTNPSQKEKIKFLKKIYGTGGFSSKCCCDLPFQVYAAEYSPKGHKIRYYNEDMQEVVVHLSYGDLVEKITELISIGEY